MLKPLTLAALLVAPLAHSTPPDFICQLPGIDWSTKPETTIKDFFVLSHSPKTGYTILWEDQEAMPCRVQTPPISRVWRQKRRVRVLFGSRNFLPHHTYRQPIQTVRASRLLRGGTMSEGQLQVTTTKLEDTFICAYLEAMDFTELGDIDQPDNDANLTQESERSNIIECLAFLVRAEPYLLAIINNDIGDSETIQDLYGAAGHDFWLTRNRHGCGFWHRQHIYGDTYADMFTDIAQSFGEVWPEWETDND